MRSDRPPARGAGSQAELSWPEVSRTSEPGILKELGVFLDEGVKAHTPAPLSSQMPPMMDTHLIRKRLYPSPTSPSPDSMPESLSRVGSHSGWSARRLDTMLTLYVG